ncbi:MAG: hypothetical protein IJU03_09190 [Thermoguttaceae bacterium]|nr:hypothetical protein [Thermoguttaceae bacterium]
MKSRRPKKYAEPARRALKLRHNPEFAGKSRRALALYALALSLPYPVRFARHFMLVVRHKTFVLKYCFYAGIPWRGLMHDWSKFSPTEFLESVRYFNGKRSPVGLCREIEGYSLAWLRHKGRNRHHFEFWQDSVDPTGALLRTPNVICPIPMPFPFALEMICDTIAANRAYGGRGFSAQSLYAWWMHRQSRPINMHPTTRRFCDDIYEQIHNANSPKPLKNAKEIYERAMREA